MTNFTERISNLIDKQVAHVIREARKLQNEALWLDGKSPRTPQEEQRLAELLELLHVDE